MSNYPCSWRGGARQLPHWRLNQKWSAILLVQLVLLLHITDPVKSQSLLDPLRPYDGPVASGVDTSTLNGKVLVGYQGWFNCQGDGAELGWTHWARHRFRRFGPGNVTVDLWPDVAEYGDDALFETGFRLADGSPAKVFSSFRRSTVLLHFRWMRQYGIDGAMVQRFANGLHDPKLRHHKDVVLAHAREAANREGRTYAVMYDLSGLPTGGVQRVIDDWTMLRKTMEMGSDPAYLHHRGRPLVAVWGVGFNDDRAYSLGECRELVEFLKADGCSVMLGVPTGWRQLDRDAVPDPALHEIICLADVVSPWTVGRYRTSTEVLRHRDHVWRGDIVWCRERDIDYLPVVFPGFSWHNLKPDFPLAQIPRRKGEFLWNQFLALESLDAQMVYVAMFDEVDEGTAIFKCTNNPPVGAEPFLTYEGLPSDHYLWLTGEGGRLLRGERQRTDDLPYRPSPKHGR
ncbi:MAG: hypothetical protein KatS3mg111_0931 [Pirellulaceae bacterium]|nr:MAG: hypothetical protein KatS3mg111_0931 [Pirellulaceae bacterium]